MRYFISLKSFGDVVILLNFLKRENADEFFVISYEYLRPLICSLGVKINIKYINEMKFNQVNSFYNIKNSNPIQVVSSLFKVRGYLSGLINKRDYIVFDKIGIRERFVSNSFNFLEIFSGTDNIYEDYEIFFNKKYPISYSNKKIFNIGIFPFSRVKNKNIPLFIVENLLFHFRKYGLNVKVYLHQSEIFKENISVCKYDNFSELTEIINELDLVIGADSLAGHIAEFYGKNLFIISPKVNLYWLPKYAIINNAYCTFSDYNFCIEWVKKFGKLYDTV